MAKKLDFILSADIAGSASGGVLLGEFNDWNESKGTSLKKQKDGSLKASLSLEPGTYQYRYFLNDGRWVNDQNGPAVEDANCVIHISAEDKPKKAAAPKTKTKAAEPKTAKAAPAKAAKAKK